jgi:hypothetical protein
VVSAPWYSRLVPNRSHVGLPFKAALVQVTTERFLAGFKSFDWSPNKEQ